MIDNILQTQDVQVRIPFEPLLLDMMASNLLPMGSAILERGRSAKMEIAEPVIKSEDILILLDDDFNPNNVCIVTGVFGGIGRATAVAAAANNLVTVGLDIDEREGRKTQQMA